MLHSFSPSTEALRILMIMTLGALGLFIRDSCQPNLQLWFPPAAPAPVDSEESPICSYQGNSHFPWRENDSRMLSLSFPILSKSPNRIFRIALPFVYYETIAGVPRFTPFYSTDSSKEDDHKKTTEARKVKDYTYPNLHQKQDSGACNHINRPMRWLSFLSNMI